MRLRFQIAVILIDTQGNDDFTKKGAVNVFVISTLLSSTLIYNMKGKITSGDLDYLQVFTYPIK